MGSKTKVNILSVLVNDPGQINEGRLARRAGVSASEVNRQIDDLVSIGLVSLSRVGRSKLYSINVEHFLYDALYELFRSLGSVYREIAEGVKDYAVSLGGVEAVILVGSVASGSVRQDFVDNPSDVDVVVVVDDGGNLGEMKRRLVSYTNNEVYPQYGVNAYTIVLSESEYIRGLSGDKFIITAHTYGETLFGEKPTRTSTMVTQKSTGV
ncbi:MAG: winged helix-turn-helix domain-containing protein, partial [Candidatus Bathyarchaeota archaeon]|nr:winged helix-turn-helix domain-containing protein [Candidatus Bathyarchaeota archaeon]